MGTCNSSSKNGGVGQYAVKAGTGFEYETESGKRKTIHLNSVGVVFVDGEPVIHGPMSKRESVDKLYKALKDKGDNGFKELSKKDVDKSIKERQKRQNHRDYELYGFDASDMRGARKKIIRYRRR